MSSVDIIDRLLNGQPYDRQMQREARCVLYDLLKEAAEEIVELRALQIVEEINRRFAERKEWARDTPDQLPSLKAADGFTVSVQASEFHYCSPRKNEGPYSHVECGFPKELPVAWAEWAETPDTTSTVFPYIPLIDVAREFARRGGLV